MRISDWSSDVCSSDLENDDRLIIRRGSLGLKGRALNGYVATPKAAAGKKIPGVIVIHENRGLNRHIQDVARRVALGGYFAVAPDFLSEMGGTPADEDKARGVNGRLELQGRVADAGARTRSEERRVGNEWVSQ